jgi:hypothetical protein
MPSEAASGVGNGALIPRLHYRNEASIGRRFGCLKGCVFFDTEGCGYAREFESAGACKHS